MRGLSSVRLRLWWWDAFWVPPSIGLVVGWQLQTLVDGLDEWAYRHQGVGDLVSTSAATTLLAAIGGGMITFTGFVFSFIVLILQFGSTAYSPRTVSYFLRARSTQVILGTFLLTIAYCFSALVTVGSEGRETFVPTFTVLVSLLLLAGCLMSFVALLQITGSRIRVDRVLADLGRVATSRLPAHFSIVAPGKNVSVSQPPGAALTQLVPVRYMGRSGQLVAIDVAKVLRIARQHRADLHITTRTGDGVIEGDTIGLSVADHSVDPRSLSRCLVVRTERSLRHDPLYALRLLVDIAIRALSPTVNDPTTAVRALDEIERVLRVAAKLPLGPVSFTVDRATVVQDRPGWQDFLDLALLEIIVCGSGQPQIGRRLSALFDDLETDLPTDRQTGVQRYRSLLTESIAMMPADGARRLAAVPDRQGIGGSAPLHFGASSVTDSAAG